MEMVAGVKPWKEPFRMIGITDRAIEVDHRIGMAAGPDPRIDRLAVGFVHGVGMIG